MIWLIQYKIKGDTTIHKEQIDLDIHIKWDVIDWWKENRNSKKDKEIVNCSHQGSLNIKDYYYPDKEDVGIGNYTLEMKLTKGDITVSSKLTNEKLGLHQVRAEALDNLLEILISEIIFTQEK